jgi:hypothetical protein
MSHIFMQAKPTMKPRTCLAPALLLFLAAPWTAASAANSVFRCHDGQSVSYQWSRCEAHQVESVVVVPSAPEEAAPKTPAANQATEQQRSERKSDQKTAPDLNNPVTHTITTQHVATMTRATWRQQVRSPAPYIGISDDAVLNMRGWGRPSKINRIRENRGWTEHWEYVTPSGETRNLRFHNGRLIAMDVAPAPYIIEVANAPQPRTASSTAISSASSVRAGVSVVAH